MHTQKTIDHLNSKHSKLSKSPKILSLKILRKFMIYAWMNVIWSKRKGKRVIPNVVDENPWSFDSKKEKKNCVLRGIEGKVRNGKSWSATLKILKFSNFDRSRGIKQR